MSADKRRDPDAPPRERSSALPTTRLTVPDPDDIGLPHAERSYVVPLAIALAVFILLVLARVIFG